MADFKNMGSRQEQLEALARAARGESPEDDKYIKVPGFSVLGAPKVGVIPVDPERNAQLQIERAALNGAQAVPQGMEPQSAPIKPNRPMSPEEKNAAAEEMIRQIAAKHAAASGEAPVQDDDAAMVRKMRMDAIREAAQSGRTGKAALPDYLKKY